MEQIISEPINFTPGKNPSCIDLFITYQPYLVINGGVELGFLLKKNATYGFRKALSIFSIFSQ